MEHVKSRGFRVLVLGDFRSSTELRTSRSNGARGMYVAVLDARRRSERMSWKRRGKYCAVGMRRVVPRVICTTG